MSLEDEIKILTNQLKIFCDKFNCAYRMLDSNGIVSEYNKSKNQRIIPVTKWHMYHSWPSLNGLRFLIFNEKQNGLSCAITRVGRRVFIKEDDFFKWVETNNTGKNK